MQAVEGVVVLTRDGLLGEDEGAERREKGGVDSGKALLVATAGDKGIYKIIKSNMKRQKKFSLSCRKT